MARPARPAGAPHKARGAGAAGAPPPRERTEARRRPRADSGGRPQAFVCWFRAAFPAGWLPVAEVMHSFQNCLGAGAGAQPAPGCSPPPLPFHNRSPWRASPSPTVPPGRDSGRGTTRPFPGAHAASGREGAFDLQLGPSGLVQLAAAGRERRRREGRRGMATFKWRGRRRGRRCGGGGLGFAPRRCHHCTEDYSGGGAGSYFPLLPRCCFCRLGRRRARRREREGRGRLRAEPRPCARPSGRRSRDKRSAVRGGGPAPRSPLPPAHHVLPRPPTWATHPFLLTPGRLFSAPPLRMLPCLPTPGAGFPTLLPVGARGGGRSPGAA